MQRFDVLDSFRGLCALAVVLFHAQILLSFSELGFFRNADLFVEFFFVLSGFVLCHAYGNRPFSPDVLRRFVISRTFRLLPLHLVMLAVFILLECAKLVAQHHGFSFNDPAFSGKTAPGEILPNALLMQSWLPWSESLSFNTPAWSISIEYYLYLVFGLTLLLMPRRSLQLFAAVSLVSAALLFVEPEPMLAFIRRGGTCFFAGVLLYRLYERIREAVMRLDDGPLFDALELLGVLLVYRVLTAELPHKGLLASLLFCAVILVFAFERGVISRLLRMRLFKRLGELSFSIYLTHAAVLFVFTSVAIVLSRLLGAEFTVILENPQSHQIMRYITSGDRLIDVLLTVALLGAVLMVSTFTYHCIELKGMALGRRLSQSQPRRLSRL